MAITPAASPGLQSKPPGELAVRRTRRGFTNEDDMNQKTAKKLRKQAQALTVGKPIRKLISARKFAPLTNDPQTTRGVYRALKKQVQS